MPVRRHEISSMGQEAFSPPPKKKKYFFFFFAKEYDEECESRFLSEVSQLVTRKKKNFVVIFIQRFVLGRIRERGGAGGQSYLSDSSATG